MEKEMVINHINYLEKGLTIIEEQRKQLIKKFLRLRFNTYDLKTYRQIKKDRNFIKEAINYYKFILKH